MLLLFQTFITLTSIISTHANTQCSNESPPRVPKYHLIEKCHRSKLGIAAKAHYTSLTSCRRLGIEKKALAINFSPPDAEMNEELEYSCEVLKCAEAEGGLSLVNDTRYDYYSIYGKPIPNVNSTCVPATGMFNLIQNKLNYTEALSQCRNMSSVLADVTSEQRTDALAALLAGASVDAALVGLKRNNGSVFFSVNETEIQYLERVEEDPKILSSAQSPPLARRRDALDCTTYRAWSPGHPRRYYNKFECVAVTRRKSWKSVPCKKKLPFLCELVPGGPYKIGSIFASKNVNETTDIEDKKENPTDSYKV